MGCFGSKEPKEAASGDAKTDYFNEHYSLGKELGSGGSCVVRIGHGKGKRNGQDFAIKILDRDAHGGRNGKFYQQEKEILEEIRGIENGRDVLLQLADAFDTPQNYYIVTELAKGGELFERIVDTKRYGKYTERRAALHVRTMLESLKFLHDRSIVHRDIKPENFVFATTAEDSNMILIDFGCAKRVEDEQEYTDIVGTPYYLSPECAAKKQIKTGFFLKESDIWAVGCIAYIMLTGSFPFRGSTTQQLLQEIIRKPVEYPTNIKISDEFKEFVAGCLMKHPAERFTMDEALDHPWILNATDEIIHNDILRCLKQYSYQSKLKKEVTRLLASHMNDKPQETIKKHFESIDTNGDGCLDEDELVQLLILLPGGKNKTEEVLNEEAQNMINQGDHTEDGKIDFEEFLTIWQRKLLSISDEYVESVFSVLDTDNSGMLEYAELGKVFDGKTEDELLSMLVEVDTDKDGVISLDEFKAAMKEELEQDRVQLTSNKNVFQALTVVGEHELCDAEL